MGPVADQPVRPRTPPGVGTPLRADGRPGQRHPSSHTDQIRGSEKREVVSGHPLCSQNAHDGAPTHSTSEFTATGRGVRKGKPWLNARSLT